MNPLLKTDKQQFSEILLHTKEIADRHLQHQENLPPGRIIPELPLSRLQEKGIGAVATLDLFEKEFSTQVANTAGPRYFGFVTGGSTPASVAGDWLVSALDQNACGNNDTIAPLIERQTIHFFKQLFGLDEEYFGSFVTGATMSNFVSLALGRQWVGEQQGVDFSNDGLGAVPVVIISGAPHSSIIKSLSMLGIGRKAVMKPATLPHREAVDISALEEQLKNFNGPAIVVANAGTVNTVDFDDLEAIGQLKKKYSFWMHVDAAFGGFAACSEKYANLMNGINYADSITIDAHKWLNVPYDAAMQFTRHKKLQGKVFQNQAAYLGGDKLSDDFFNYTPENSRRFRALPSWFTLMAYGREGCCEIVERNCQLAKKLGEQIHTSENFKLLAPVRMNVVCFTVNEKDVSVETIQQFLNAVRDDGRAFFTPTVYQGVPAIRAAISNWQTIENDVNTAFEALQDVYQKLNPIYSQTSR